MCHAGKKAKLLRLLERDVYSEFTLAVAEDRPNDSFP